MSSREWDRSKRRSATVSVLTVLALTAAIIMVLATGGVPETWWPRTGEAFAASTRAKPAGDDPCALIVGPAKDYCHRGASPASYPPPRHHEFDRGDVWTLVPPGAGLIALLIVRRTRWAR